MNVGDKIGRTMIGVDGQLFCGEQVNVPRFEGQIQYYLKKMFSYIVTASKLNAKIISSKAFHTGGTEVPELIVNGVCYHNTLLFRVRIDAKYKGDLEGCVSTTIRDINENMYSYDNIFPAHSVRPRLSFNLQIVTRDGIPIIGDSINMAQIIIRKEDIFYDYTISINYAHLPHLSYKVLANVLDTFTSQLNSTLEHKVRREAIKSLFDYLLQDYVIAIVGTFRDSEDVGEELSKIVVSEPYAKVSKIANFRHLMRSFTIYVKAKQKYVEEVILEELKLIAGSLFEISSRSLTENEDLCAITVVDRDKSTTYM